MSNVNLVFEGTLPQLKIKTLVNKKQKYLIPPNLLNAFSFDKQGGGKEEYTPNARLLKTTHLVIILYIRL